MPRFSLAQLRNVGTPNFTGITFTDWIADEAISPSTNDDRNGDDDLVRDMVEEGKLVLAGYLDPTCVFVQEEAFDRIVRTASWRLPGQDPWPQQAHSPFTAIASYLMRLFRRFGPQPIEAHIGSCQSPGGAGTKQVKL
ncbi:MAG: hypothetical protein ACJ746_22630 [Bryobacteraceae bacterium]